ncbi:MAG: hypothetical protein LM561_01565 [Desulfurococcaceae archaeon]|nr:hypothetical protein [Desulfurococcaceae archaeon]
MGSGNFRVAKQNVIGGLLVFTILIGVSLALGFYGYYVEKAPRTTTKTTTTSPTTTPSNTTTPTNTTSPSVSTTPTTTPTNTTTTSEAPYVPE